MADKRKPVSWVDLLPDADLLNQWQGVEEGLRRRRQIGWAGALIAAFVQIAVSLQSHPEFLEAFKEIGIHHLKDLDIHHLSTAIDTLIPYWDLILPGTLGVFCVVLYRWSGFWLNESEQSFRYTCSIEPFKPAISDDPTSADAKLDRLKFHLTERMDTRIGRLRFTEEDKITSSDASSHIHIRGKYLISRPDPETSELPTTKSQKINAPKTGPQNSEKQQADSQGAAEAAKAEVGDEPVATATGIDDAGGEKTLEVQIFVRIGGSTKPETLGHLVEFPLDGAAISTNEYYAILERVYFSAATEIYHQISEDVKSKIALLPTRRFKATALFYEAQDYARSDTLDAFEEARPIFQRCVRLLDLAACELPKSWFRRQAAQARLVLQAPLTAMRRAGAQFVPSLGKRDVLCARAELGNAEMLLQSYMLAGLYSRATPAIFAVPAMIDRAIGRLRGIPDDTNDRQAALYRAYVFRAWAEIALLAPDDARDWLKKARDLPPPPENLEFRADMDPLFTLVKGFLTAHPKQKADIFQHAQELAPEFQIAKVSLGNSKEGLWRSTPGFRHAGAETILDQYARLTRDNPGLVGIWANQGYLCWMLAGENDLEKHEKRLQQSEAHFKNGRRYKEIKHETTMTELDYGLARIAAERGDFEAAYGHLTEMLSCWSSVDLSFRDYYSWYIDKDLVKRFKSYRKTVEGKLPPMELGKEGTAPAVSQRRLHNVVRAFVENDCGQAYLAYYFRSGDESFFVEANNAFNNAIKFDPAFPLPYLNRADLKRSLPNQQPEAEQDLKRCLDFSPEWAYANKALAELYLKYASEYASQANSAREDLNKKVLEVPRSGRRRAPTVDQASPGTACLTQSDEFIAEQYKLSRLYKQASEAEKNALAILREQLPLSWLWTSTGEFDWQLLQNRSKAARDRWVCDLNEMAASCLFSFAEAAIGRPNGSEDAQQLLELLRRTFFRNRTQSLVALRDAPAPSPVVSRSTPVSDPVLIKEMLQDILENSLREDLIDNRRLTDGWIAAKIRLELATINSVINAPGITPKTLTAIADYLASPDSVAEYADSAEEIRHIAEHACGLAIECGDALSWPDAARSAERLGVWPKAIDAWTKLEKTLSPSDASHADACLGLAVASWMEGKQDAAFELLERLAAKNAPARGWREDFMRRVALHPLSTSDRLKLRSWLCIQRDLGSKDVQNDALFGCLAMARTAASTPTIKPLSMVIATDIWVSKRDSQILQMIKSKREDVAGRLGIVLPGVFVTDDRSYSSGTFKILIDEISVLDGQATSYPIVTRLWDWFASSVLQRHAFEAWPSRWGRLTAWHYRWEKLTDQLKDVLLSHAAEFFGVEEMDQFLRREIQQDDAKPLLPWQKRVASILGDPALFGELLAVLKGLLRERVPITDLATIVDVFDAERERGRLTVIDQLHYRLRDILVIPRETRLIPLPAEHEKLLKSLLSSNLKSGLIVVHDSRIKNLQAWLTDKQQAEPGKPAVIVVKEREVRPVLAGLCQTPVLWWREVHRDRRKELPTSWQTA